MQTVTSPDNTRIAYEEFGDGPPLILLHGGSETRRAWNALHPHLVDEYTLIVPDRRGRGESGDADEYSLTREVGDLFAIVDAVNDDVSVFGHSFGGLVALAATDETKLKNLVLYEPPILVGDQTANADLTEQMRELTETGNREGAMEVFYQQGAGIPDPRRLPAWPDRINFDLIDTVIRESVAVEDYNLPTRISFEIPTLLLTGEHSPSHLRDASQTLNDRLPNSRLVELAGVGHVATLFAPEQVATEVKMFL
jgi:pimeloyl-ACP methyl ester carboxylesterase